MSPMNNRRMTPMAEPGILDFAPGAAAAYSLRNLSLSYAGPVVTVRRSTDNAEADFTASEVSDGTLAAWCGGGDGFVKQWWSQTGSNHATQSTAGYQPQLIDSGALITEGGNAALSFDGTDDRIVTQDANDLSASFFISAVFNLTGGTGERCFFDDGSNRWRVTGNPRIDGLSTSGFDALGKYIVVYQSISGESNTIFLNGASVFSTVDTNSPAPASMTIGTQSNGAQAGAGTFSELLIYPTDQTALRQRIEGNIAWYY